MPKKAATSVAKTASATSNEMMGIQELFKATWEHLGLVWKKLLIISLIVTALMFGLTVAMSLVAGVFGVAMVAGAIGGSFSLAAFLPMILVALVGTLGAVVIVSAFEAGMLLVIAEPKATESAWSLTKRGFAFAVPIIVANIVLGLLILGGMALFIIPGLAIAILLSFVLYEIVLEKQNLGSALAASTAIIKQNFSAVFMRWLAAVGIVFLLGLVLTVMMIIPGINVLLAFLNPVISAVLSWFMLIYWFFVYKQAREKTNFSQTASVTWMYVVSVIGWVLMIFTIMSVGAMLTVVLSALSSNNSRKSAPYNDIMEGISPEVGEYDSELNAFDPELFFNEALLEESLTDQDRQQIENIKKMMESGEFPLAE